ncbi:MAG: hypothetical protein HFG41_13490 [Coprococcus sp.]|nr:hypothetical protein [Coprococcus sp.]
MEADIREGWHIGKKILKLAAVNLAIVIVAVILYSPGLVCLRITDYSIFRAGMSVIAALALVGLFFAANIYILKEPKKKPIEIEKITDLDKAKSILKSYGNSRFFGNFSRTASGQLDRILKCRNRLSGILEQKFAEGTMSWDKFNSVALAAESSAIRNVVAMANRMQLFDEAEYAKLQHYREDDIPDDIQEEQIRLYQKNFDAVKSTIALNEKILLKLDALSMELATSEAGSNEELNSDLLGEIEKLIDETKYYQ